MVLPCLRGTTASFGGSLANPFGGNDFNGDGVGDPAIGAVGEDLGSVGNAGAGGYPVTSAGGQPRGHHSIRLGIQELGHE
jgi:hypothetical protein